MKQVDYLKVLSDRLNGNLPAEAVENVQRAIDACECKIVEINGTTRSNEILGELFGSMAECYGGNE